MHFLFIFHNPIAIHNIYNTAYTGESGSGRISLFNSRPSITKKSSFGPRMPHFIAMDLAVFMLSPVTMRTVIPAFWQRRIASGTYIYRKKTTHEYTYRHLFYMKSATKRFATSMSIQTDKQWY